MIKAISAIFLSALFVASGFAQANVVYNSILAPEPGNVASQPFEAQQVAEFGDAVQFSSGTGRKLTSMTHTMSSWGCEAGSWYGNNCTTTPGAAFAVPITVRFYNVNSDGSVGTAIGSPITQTFNVPYRPSKDPINCTGDDAGKWFDVSDSTCYNGFATNITFNFSTPISVPDRVIYSIAYNTTHYGYAPVGEAAPCYTSSGGCGYDSLNVGLEGVTSVGTNLDLTDAYLYATYAGAYCGGPTAVFRRDNADGCWAGYQPQVSFSVYTNVPANADQCKKDGWSARTRANGSTFKNQGDCVSYVNTGK
jgi:hypothetical protein